MIWSAGTTAGSSITGQMSTTIVAGYNVANAMYQLMACTMNGILHACSVTIGKTIGSGASREEIQREAYSLILIGLVGGSVLGMLTLLGGDLFISFYSLTDATRAIRERIYLRSLLAIWPFSGMEMTGMIAVLRCGEEMEKRDLSPISSPCGSSRSRLRPQGHLCGISPRM